MILGLVLKDPMLLLLIVILTMKKKVFEQIPNWGTKLLYVLTCQIFNEIQACY